MKEADLHRLVGDYLNLALMPPTWWTTFPADGAARRGRIGLKRGVPDILIIHQGRAYWIELKTPRGRISDHQVVTSYALHDAGCNLMLALTLDHVIADLTRWRIPLNPAVRIAA